MDIKKLLAQIGSLIDEKLDLKLEPIKKQLTALDNKFGSLDKKVGSLDKKVGSLDNRVGSLEVKYVSLDKKIDTLEETLVQKIDESQKNTINVLSELINDTYATHEKRIKRIEKHLQLPSVE